MAKGDITHVEFPADDLERAMRFYTAVAGWQFNEMEGAPGFWLFDNGNGSGGGIGKRGESVADEIRVYIAVDALEPAVEAAVANGGAVITPPTDVPDYGRWAVLRDSEGSTIALWQSASS